MEQQEGTARVSTAGIARKGDKFLVALRKPGTSIGESWEFPGGKKRESESAKQALKREFLEELSVEVVVGEKIFSDSFFNRDTEYILEAYSVKLITETFILKEHQSIKWVSLPDLKHLEMAPSDRAIVHYLEREC